MHMFLKVSLVLDTSRIEDDWLVFSLPFRRSSLSLVIQSYFLSDQCQTEDFYYKLIYVSATSFKLAAYNNPKAHSNNHLE